MEHNILSQDLLHGELNLLAAVLRSQHRTRVYRHHLFMRHALRVHRVVKKTMKKARKVSLRKAMRTIVAAGAASLEETCGRRIDTLPLNLLLLGIFSRLRVLLTISDDDGPQVVRVKDAAVRPPDSLHGLDNKRSVQDKSMGTTRHTTIGEILNHFNGLAAFSTSRRRRKIT